MPRLSPSVENMSTILSIAAACTRSRYTLFSTVLVELQLCESEVHDPSKIASWNWKSRGTRPGAP